MKRTLLLLLVAVNAYADYLPPFEGPAVCRSSWRNMQRALGPVETVPPEAEKGSTFPYTSPDETVRKLVADEERISQIADEELSLKSKKAKTLFNEYLGDKAVPSHENLDVVERFSHMLVEIAEMQKEANWLLERGDAEKAKATVSKYRIPEQKVQVPVPNNPSSKVATVVTDYEVLAAATQVANDPRVPPLYRQFIHNHLSDLKTTELEPTYILTDLVVGLDERFCKGERFLTPLYEKQSKRKPR